MDRVRRADQTRKHQQYNTSQYWQATGAVYMKIRVDCSAQLLHSEDARMLWQLMPEGWTDKGPGCEVKACTQLQNNQS